MKYKVCAIIIISVLNCFSAFAQSITGKITDNKGEPIAGANVYWLNTTIGTSTNNRGEFKLSLQKTSSKKLIVSFVGYKTDTIDITNQKSISGQINVELKDPEESEKLLLNLYVNSFLETQFNANFSHKFKKWSTLVAAHTTQPANKFDRDGDTFLDLPLITRYSLYNKWKYGNEKNWGFHSLIGIRYVNEKRIGGQTNFNPATDEGTTDYYGQTLKYSQPEIYTKTGYRFNSTKSIVLISSAFYQIQNSSFGVTLYDAKQTNFYANLQFELKWNKKHLLKTGFSCRY